MTLGITSIWENIDASDIDPKYNSSDYTIEGTETKDANGKLLSRTYTIRDKNGNVIRTGSITYDADGKPTVKSYIEHYDKPTPLVTIKEKAPDGDPTGEALALLDPAVEAATTESTEVITYNEDGSEYKSESEVKKTFDGGGHTEMDYETTGKVKEGELLPEERNGEGDVTTSEGDHFDAETHETWTDEQDGDVTHKSEIELTGDDGMKITEKKIDTDNDRNGAADEGKMTSTQVETTEIPTEKQEDIANTVLEQTGSDTTIKVDQNATQDSTTTVTSDGKLETTVKGVDSTSTLEIDNPTNKFNDGSYSTQQAQIQAGESTTGSISRSSSLGSDNPPVAETDYSFGDSGNSGTYEFTSRNGTKNQELYGYPGKTKTEYTLEYNQSTGKVTETVTVWSVDRDGNYLDILDDRSSTVDYQVNDVTITSPRGEVTIKYNPNTEAGQRYLAETVATMTTTESNTDLIYDNCRQGFDYNGQMHAAEDITITYNGGEFSNGSQIYTNDADGGNVKPKN